MAYDKGKHPASIDFAQTNTKYSLHIFWDLRIYCLHFVINRALSDVDQNRLLGVF